MQWSFVVATRAYEPIGELLDYTEMSVNIKLNGVDSLSFKIREDNAFFDELRSADAYIKAYRDGVLMFFGPVWTSETVGDAEKMTLAVTAMAPAVFLEGYYPAIPRYANTPNTDFYPNNHLITSGAIDRHQAFASLWLRSASDRLGTQSYAAYGGGDYGMPLLVKPETIGSALSYMDTRDDDFLPLSEYLEKLAGGPPGVGMEYRWQPHEVQIWRIRQNTTPDMSPLTASLPRDVVYSGGNPVDIGRIKTTVGGGPTIEMLPTTYTGYPANYWTDGYGSHVVNPIATFKSSLHYGTTRNDTVFEYNYGTHSLTDYKDVTTRQYQRGTLYYKKPGKEAKPDPFYVETLGYTPPQPRTWPSTASVASYDTTDESLAAGLGELEHTLRRLPRRRIEITPRKSTGSKLDPPQYLEHYDLGDTVFVNAKTRSGTLLLSGAVRIYAISFTITDSGAESVALTIAEE